MHFTAFHPDWKMLDRTRTPPATLTRARAIALKNGVRYAYTGNVFDEAGESTYCHGCGEVLIRRNWFVLSGWRLTPDGRCCNCGARAAPVCSTRGPEPGARAGCRSCCAIPRESGTPAPRLR